MFRSCRSRAGSESDIGTCLMGKLEGLRHVEKVGRIMHLVSRRAYSSGWLFGVHVLNGNCLDGWGMGMGMGIDCCICGSVGYGFSGSPFHRQIRAII